MAIKPSPDYVTCVIKSISTTKNTAYGSPLTYARIILINFTNK